MSSRGQSTLEYAVMIAIFISAAIGAQVYVKRGLMGRHEETFDSLGATYIPARTVSMGGGERLAQTGTSTDVSKVIREDEKVFVELTTTFDETTTETGGTTVTINSSEELFE